ncbi:MAG: hypothetical protein JWO09_247 [Bacteroidetes bacterium]|nr:hypothetical protein [Bacteroidota bacterium]
MHKKAFSRLLLLCSGCLLIAGCGSESNSPGDAPAKDSVSMLIPARSQFRFYNKKEFRISDNGFIEAVANKAPDTLSEAQQKAWDYESPGFGHPLTAPYCDITFYSMQAPVHSLFPIVLEAFADDYLAYTLLVVDRQGKLLSNTDLAGGVSGGPDSTFDGNGKDSSGYFTHDKYSSFTSDSTFNTSCINYVYTNGANHTIDSVVSHYVIGNDGRIRLLTKDSVRVLKK